MELLKKIKDAGIVGAGGAGFPTHVKLNCKVEYFILNGLECEPLLQSDKYLMRNESDHIVSTAEKIGSEIEAEHIIIGLKEEYYDEMLALRESIEKLNSKVELHLSKTFYPAGDEQTLVYEITGRTIPPGGIPLNVGAVVSNVGTVFNVYEALQGKPVTYKFVTVIGEISKPSIIKVPIGTPVKQCIQECGGATVDDYMVIMGGPMMGKLLSRELFESRVITKTDGAILVIPADHYLVQREKMTIKHMKNQAKSACIQCHYCTDMCPRFLIGHPLHPHRIMRGVALSEDNDELFKEALICCECGICELYACPMGLSPERINVYFKGKLREKGVRWKNTGDVFEGHILRDYRKVPTERLISRLSLNKYVDQPIEEGREINPKRVSIPLKQGIGAPASPVVKVGDKVERGQLIAEIEEGKMGSNVHATIEGEVVEVSQNVVINTIQVEVIP